jgi:hypothetical protein
MRHNKKRKSSQRLKKALKKHWETKCREYRPASLDAAQEGVFFFFIQKLEMLTHFFSYTFPHGKKSRKTTQPSSCPGSPFYL